jgi:hypothetical protein
VIAGRVKHGCRLQVPQRTEPVVGRGTAYEYAHTGAGELVAGQTSILECFICDLKKKTLLGIYSTVSKVLVSHPEIDLPMASASCLVILKKGASNIAGSCLRKYPALVLMQPFFAGFG